ncbi:MAG: 5-formyltetrahydrofolate cyclo-ligase [Desulfuromonas sp.]|nr:5-formyltetrahydrofolate cyclo-ligase [Desulfuromonas sp.]
MPKNRFREKQLQLRSKLDALSFDQFSHQAQCRVQQLEEFQQARTVALYSPIRGEVATCQLLAEALLADKRVVYPRVDANKMVFVQIESESQLRPGTFGVSEPVGQEIVAPAELDLVIVPGVAFGRCGSRLGYGKGYYDQTFENRPSSCVLVGLGFSFQLEDHLPKEEHDVGLDWIVTDREVLSFDGGL